MAMVDNSRDSFPIGMRVLAVDDNPTCLRILEALLKKCQYHVTATKSAIMALQLLRENKEKFDLVISDVHMPDMDGFKLLELVGLEMDLPVIMLSVNDDPGMVMKGIHHGACDYLLKPIRIEALKTIWRHVVRLKKVDSKEQNKNSSQDKPDSGSCNGLGSSATESSEQNGKPTKKRKDQDEDDDADHENANDNDDSSSQKKPRVVWSVDLHRKFVSAVNQLGIDKAVPKKILDLMSDEKLTRENVASHLQKYRLYLKKANMMASSSGSDSSYYLRTSSLSGFGHLHTLSGSSQFHSNGFRSLSPGGMTTSRFNTPSGLNLHGLNFAGTRPFGQALNLNNSGNDQQFQSPFACSNQNFLSGGLDSLQQNKGVSSVQNLNSTLYDYNYDYKPSFPISNRLADQGLKVTMGCSNNAFMLEQTPRATQGVGAYDTPTSELCSPSLDHVRSSDIFSAPLPSSYPSNEYFMPAAIPPTNNMTPTTTFQGGNFSGASSITSLSSQSPDSFTDMYSQGLTFTNNNNNPGQISNNVPFPGWDDHNQNASYNSNVIGSSMNSLTPMNGAIDHEGHAPSNYTFNRNLDSDFDLFQLNHGGTGALTDEKPPKPLQLYTMNQQKSQYSRISSSHGSLEDLVSEIMKQKPDKVKLSDEDYLFDNYYPGGTDM